MILLDDVFDKEVNLICAEWIWFWKIYFENMMWHFNIKQFIALCLLRMSTRKKKLHDKFYRSHSICVCAVQLPYMLTSLFVTMSSSWNSLLSFVVSFNLILLDITIKIMILGSFTLMIFSICHYELLKFSFVFFSYLSSGLS